MLGGLNPFEGDLFFRWLILGAKLAGGGVPRCSALAPAAYSRARLLAAAVLAVLINLLAAGGIGIPTVALGFGRCWRSA